MTPEVFKHFSLCLQRFPHAKDSPWATEAKWYFDMLSPIPDADAEIMFVAIGVKFGTKDNPFRPMPAAIMDLWREIKNPKKMSAVEAVDRILEAVKTGRIGVAMVPRTVHLRTPSAATGEQIRSKLMGALRIGAKEEEVARRSPATSRLQPLSLPKLNLDLGTPVEIKVPTPVKLSGQPDSITNDPVLRKIVKVMGGWESLSTNKSEYLRGQLMKVAQAVLVDAGDEVLQELRLGYANILALQGEGMKELE